MADIRPIYSIYKMADIGLVYDRLGKNVEIGKISTRINKLEKKRTVL